MTNSAEPDQMASEEAIWSGSTLFAKEGQMPGSKSGFSRTRVNFRHIHDFYFWEHVVTISQLAASCKNLFWGICGQRTSSACPSANSDQGVHCPLTESLDTTEFMNGEHITKTSLFKYTENFNHQKWKFSDKNSDISHTSGQNIDCGYLLELPRRGGSNEYPQSMFLGRNKKK